MTTYPPLPIHREIAVDLFAGGGGASEGFRMAMGCDPDVAVNHDPEAVAMHAANHPGTRHLCQDVWQVPPRWATQGRRVGFLWASPDCTHFSKAKGAAPRRDQKRRDLAWVIEKWAREVRPRVMAMENVEEFLGWGPLDRHGSPIKARKGETFAQFVKALRRLGYRVDHRELRACDYGAPTIRKRLFLIARRDGQPIAWPEPTHGPGRPQPWRTAAECIDWSLPCPSIFDRKRPLADATLRRIAKGIVRYVIEAAEPFLIPVTHMGDDRCWPSSEPLRTVTTAQRGEFALVTPFLEAHYGTKGGQDLRVHPADAPARTVSTENRFGLVAAFLAKHYGGVVGSPLAAPIGSVTSVDHHSLVAAHLTKFYGASVGSGCGEPIHTVTSGGDAARMSTGLKHGLVAAFLTKYYGQGIGCDLQDPAATVTARDRMGLVTVQVVGEPYVIADIGLRMLQPRELYRAQGFPDSYVIDLEVDGRPLPKTAQVRMCGNSVCPPVAAAIIRANYTPAETIPEPRGLPLLAGA